MKVCRKAINIIIIMIIALMCYSNVSYVYGVRLEDIEVELKKGKGESDTTQKNQGKEEKDPITNPDFYEPIDTTGKNTEFIKLGNIVIGTLRVIGTIVSVVALMAIGLKYMLGSVSERAAYKETMIPYIVGAIMLFTIPHVLGIVYDLVKGIQFTNPTE